MYFDNCKAALARRSNREDYQMAKDFVIGLVVAVLVLAIGFGGIIAGAKISEWEKANAYPYGKLCDLYASCDR